VKLFHGDLEFQVDDDWWDEAGMAGFVSSKHLYRVTPDARQPFVVRIDDIQPVRRKLNAGMFNDDCDKGLSAKERVISILGAIRDDVPLHPLEVEESPAGSPHRYTLTQGTHRLYLSLAAGFSHVPAVTGFDWATLDQ
jgi:hypothetical protein